MLKIKLLLLFLIPLSVYAQLDKIKEGMPKDDFGNIFPGMKPDISSMSSWIYTNDTVEGLAGNMGYTIRLDTLYSTDFTTNEIKGPCYDFPHTDSIKYLRLIKTANKLYNQYFSLYGKPVEFFTQSNLADDSSKVPVPVFYALWKQGDNEMSISVSRQGKHKEFHMNEPPTTDEEMKPGCSYSLEIKSEGSGSIFKPSCGNGIKGGEFKKAHPNLASQVKDYDDSWIASDTLTNHYADWRLGFINGYLDEFSFDCDAGQQYGNSPDSAYSLLRRRCLKFFAEAKTTYRKPDTCTESIPEKYPGKGTWLYHDTTHFIAKWKMNGKTLYIMMKEWGGGKQFEHVFNLQVYFGRKNIEE